MFTDRTDRPRCVDCVEFVTFYCWFTILCYMLIAYFVLLSPAYRCLFTGSLAIWLFLILSCYLHNYVCHIFLIAYYRHRLQVGLLGLVSPNVIPALC